MCILFVSIPLRVVATRFASQVTIRRVLGDRYLSFLFFFVRFFFIFLEEKNISGVFRCKLAVRGSEEGGVALQFRHSSRQERISIHPTVAWAGQPGIQAQRLMA